MCITMSLGKAVGGRSEPLWFVIVTVIAGGVNCVGRITGGGRLCCVLCGGGCILIRLRFAAMCAVICDIVYIPFDVPWLLEGDVCDAVIIVVR